MKQAAAAAALVNPLLKSGSSGQPQASAAAAATAAAASASSEADLVGHLLKSNPALLLNPALLSLNPSLYAVQLAQLQLLTQQGGGSGSAEALRRLSGGGGQGDANDAFASAVAASTNPLAQVRKRKHEDSESDFNNPMSALAGVLNLTASKNSPASSPRLAESPLDLSGSKKLESPGGLPKIPRLSEADKMASAASMGAWPFLHPLLAAGGLTPEALTRLQMAGMPQVSQAMEVVASSGGVGPKNPLERMSEIAKGSSSAVASSQQHSPASMSTSPNSAASRGLQASAPGTRPSAWQSQWLNRGPESNKDIFKCVWCKESFPSLQSLTTHMKETKHFGASIPPSPTLPPSAPPNRQAAIPSPNNPAMDRVHRPGQGQSAGGHQPGQHAAAVASAASMGPNSKGGGRDILKEQLPMPRKLVRGQDVWLGRGEQQTRDILKCMWCGESFRSLDLMTKHMQETKHYTKVISQEQLMSWKSPEAAASSQNHVNAVLTCKVCEQAFSTLKDLSDHMVKNNHYKQDTDAGAGGGGGGSGNNQRRPGSTSPRAGPVMPMAPSPGQAGGQQGGQKEKRKKSLPVRKLLELERAQQELTGQVKPSDPAGRIACEKCGDKILMHLFVDHIRQCVGPTMMKTSTPPASSTMASTAVAMNSMADLNRFLASGGGSTTSAAVSTPRTPSVSPPSSLGLGMKKASASPSTPPPPSSVSQTASSESGPKSILGSLEKMVQNNFGTKKRVPDSNMSILQRLGIDEGVDYNKPLMDPMAMFRSPSQMAAAVAAAAASGNLPPGFLPPPPFSTATSTTTRSNSSECSSPDRFRTSAEGGRPSSTKSATSDKSPALDEVPLAASMIKKHAVAAPAAVSTTVASVEGDDEDKQTNEPDLNISEDKSEDHHMDNDDEDEDNNSSSEAARPRRRTRSSSRKTGEVEGAEDEDNSIKCEIASSPTPSKSSDVDSHLQRRSASTSPVAPAEASNLMSMTKEDSDREVGPATPSEDESRSKGGGQSDSAPKPTQGPTNKKKPNSHPLAALQMLCDKTEKKTSGGQGGAQGQVKSGPGNGSSSSVFGQGTTDPGAILAFSWACNQAVVNDSLLKCPFCDTPFISKGAYRHHLSKMHFVKEGGGVVASPDVKLLKSGAGSGAGNTPASASGGSASDSKEENTQSKFQKYSQLAKQLSCGSSQP